MPPDGGGAAKVSGANAHCRALEALYAAAPINRLFDSRLEIAGEGTARIHFTIDSRYHHAAGALHGTGTFMRSVFALLSLAGYSQAVP